MPSTRPFVDASTGSLDWGQLFAEAVPLARLIAVVVAVSLVPFALVFFLFGDSLLGMLATILAQFVLAVGTGLVLLYVVARGIRLAEA